MVVNTFTFVSVNVLFESDVGMATVYERNIKPS